jgi:hypothetical protein
MLPKSVFGGQWGRLFWSPFLHGDNMHLYFNMSSLLWKVWKRCTAGSTAPLRCVVAFLGHDCMAGDCMGCRL